ncbi:hypothetical protein [Agromyces bauzanensis]|uniref:Uncharacterized protein n=1 Tax=Agromyces bauzanensis TaxID=1308924 RepID=A0A917PJE3_9MICO|nr:hypothetical protein [Agromyces bauzanensis]GGJ81671.1 hypothetical protein GCM10011372_20210 [Agromyces bauzanensis]
MSGDQLTAQASMQAFKFGVRVFAPCEAVSLTSAPDARHVTLAEGAGIHYAAALSVRSRHPAFIGLRPGHPRLAAWDDVKRSRPG